MLKRISIKNYALIETLEIEWNQGLNVITGETGAGKSIVIDALTLILGQRGNKDNIRHGAGKMVVQGVFGVGKNEALLNLLDAMAIEVEDGDLILTRSIDRRGRNQCRANGFSLTVAQLKSLGATLVDIYSQHEQNSLFLNETQRRLLDAYGGQAVARLLDETRDQATRLKILNKTIREQEKDDRELMRQKEIYAFELKDIRKAELVSGEDNQLEKERRILENGEQLFSTANEACELLNGDEMENSGLLTSLAQVADRIGRIAAIDDQFSPYLTSLSSATGDLEDLGLELSRYLDTMDFDPARLEVVEKRMAVIDGLKRKYGATVDDIMAYGQELQDKYDRLAHHDDDLEQNKAEYKILWRQYRKSASDLHAARAEAAGRLKKDLETELADLAMDKANVQIRVEEDAQVIAPWGNDTVSFWISVNPGVAPGPLKKVASGGEISRIMLAVKSIFGAMDHIETMIFDEIDTGISGRTAQTVAEKIMGLSQKRQIICITHLPQITAMADRHFRVEKSMDDESVEVDFAQLSPEESRDELARMISGAKVTKKTVEHAAEMLEMSKKTKKSKKQAK